MKYVRITCRMRHQNGFIDRTFVLNNTSLYQRSQEMLLKMREIKRFICMVTRPQWRELEIRKMKREMVRKTREMIRPASIKMFMEFRNLWSS